MYLNRIMAKRPATKQVPHMRWMIRRDLPEVLAIEEESFAYPWDEATFIQHQRRRNCIGMVAEHDDRVVGFMVYELDKRRIHLIDFAVASECWRQGVGTTMVDTLKRKLSTQRRTRIVLEVSEYNTRAQLFFRACGLRAEAVLRGYYEEQNEDAYVMAYRYGGES